MVETERERPGGIVPKASIGLGCVARVDGAAGMRAA
jgi:hypothetical protein